MGDKSRVPLHFTVEVEEFLRRPAGQRWRAQFSFYPFGYFRGDGSTPPEAFKRAWRKFKKEIDPGKRWWAMVQGPVQQVRV